MIFFMKILYHFIKLKLDIAMKSYAIINKNKVQFITKISFDLPIIFVK